MPRKDRKPPMALRRKYAPLIALCREKIILAPPQTSGKEGCDQRIYVNVKWPTREGTNGRMIADVPDDFPTGTYVDRAESFVVIRHNVVALLKWFQAKKYIDYCARDLFASRHGIMIAIGRTELDLLKGLDAEKEALYNTHIESEE
jgi:hypothetical protein